MSTKSVRFNPINTIITTYSADEYDRSCFASSVMPTSYTFRPLPPCVSQPQQAITTTPEFLAATPIVPSQCKRPMIKPLDLSVIPNSRRRALESPPLTPSTPLNNKKKPRLSINTTSLTPLFFSGLSTHYKCRDEDEEEEHGYLVPVMAAC